MNKTGLDKKNNLSSESGTERTTPRCSCTRTAPAASGAAFSPTPAEGWSAAAPVACSMPQTLCKVLALCVSVLRCARARAETPQHPALAAIGVRECQLALQRPLHQAEHLHASAQRPYKCWQAMFNLHAESLSHGCASPWTSLRSHPQEVGRLSVLLGNLHSAICTEMACEPTS